jgi:hypothetical protein
VDGKGVKALIGLKKFPILIAKSIPAKQGRKQGAAGKIFNWKRINAGERR